MKRFLIVLVLLVAGVVGLGFYQGWWNVSVDQEKIRQDRDKVLGGKGQEQTGGRADKAHGPEGRP